MADDLTFEGPFDIGTRETPIGLPYNLLPAALGEIAIPQGRTNRVIFQLPNTGNAGDLGLNYHIVGAKTLGDPVALEDFLRTRELSDDNFERCLLGPPIELDETARDAPRRLNFSEIRPINADAYEKAAVIIDIGIAFWNKRFRVGETGPCRFKEMRFLSFETAGAMTSLPTTGADSIKSLCDLYDGPSGQDAVIARLGSLFPGSYFGPGGWARSESQWHGTATADLMAGLTEPDTDTALYGIEVPMSVLKDADGDSLTTVLPLMLKTALEMTKNFGSKPTIIVIPWGFSAGLQDGTHPAAVAMQTFLQAATGRNIKLLVPSGNQLQDRCCAHLTPSASATANAATWRMPADDFSKNSVELFVTPPEPQDVAVAQIIRITAPSRPVLEIGIKQNQFFRILRDGQPIGILMRFGDMQSARRLRLSFFATGWGSARQLPTPAGDWLISAAPDHDVRLWILRDDRNRFQDGPYPRRPSSFVDPAYQEKDNNGAFLLDDNPGSSVLRSGTVSVLATTPSAVQVQANEKLVGVAQRQAWYSGRRQDGRAITVTAVVDQDRQSGGVMAAADGTSRRMRISGTSAAVAIHAHDLLYPPPP
jgi:hypothetical protein